MNCKPRDLAIVSRLLPDATDVDRAVFRLIVGRVVRVLRIAEAPDMWEIETPIDVSGCTWFTFGSRATLTAGEVTSLRDGMLTPIPALPLDEELHDEVPCEHA